MARYYGEDSPIFTESPSKKLSNVAQLLSHEYWRGQIQGQERLDGQLQGSHGPVHARHMKSRCSLIQMSTYSPFPVQDYGSLVSHPSPTGH